MPTPRPGSRKATIYETFFEGGLDAALKQGADLNLATGTIKSWCSGWSKEQRPVPRGKPLKDGSLERVGKKPKEWSEYKGKRVRLFWLDQMGWGMAPQDAKVGDRFAWGAHRYLIVSSNSILMLKKIGTT